VHSLGGSARETASLQTVRLRLAPVLFNAEGEVPAEAEQLVSGNDRHSGAGTEAAPSHEPE
jgi:hypothetical protein